MARRPDSRYVAEVVALKMDSDDEIVLGVLDEVIGSDNDHPYVYVTVLRYVHEEG